MIVLDTTVLVYAVGAEHPLRNPCRALVEMIDGRAVTATTTPEVLQEFCHVRARRRDRRDATELTRRYSELLTPLRSVDADDLDDGLALFAEYEALGAFDAVLAAIARRAGAALVSADKAFGVVRGLTWFDPSSDEFIDVVRRHG